MSVCHVSACLHGMGLDKWNRDRCRWLLLARLINRQDLVFDE